MNSLNGRILAIDYGAKRIGVALSDETNTIAFGKCIIEGGKKYLEEITKMIRANNVSQVVVGYPLNLKGNKSAQTLDVEEFEEELRNYLNARFEKNINLVRWDERFTSKMAIDSMLESGMKKKNRRDKKNIDIISAALLLQSYLDNLKSRITDS